MAALPRPGTDGLVDLPRPGTDDLVALPRPGPGRGGCTVPLGAASIMADGGRSAVGRLLTTDNIRIKEPRARNRDGCWDNRSV